MLLTPMLNTRERAFSATHIVISYYAAGAFVALFIIILSATADADIIFMLRWYWRLFLSDYATSLLIIDISPEYAIFRRYATPSAIIRVHYATPLFIAISLRCRFTPLRQPLRCVAADAIRLSLTRCHYRHAMLVYATRAFSTPLNICL